MPDGVYKLRVQGYNLVAGSLVPVTIPSCGGPDPSLNPPSEVIIAVDNRLDPDPLHATYPPHPCGPDTVHGCITEPDTDFLQVTIVHGALRTPVLACGQTRWPTPTRRDSASTRTIQRDLQSYTIWAYYGENDRFPIVPGSPRSACDGGRHSGRRRPRRPRAEYLRGRALGAVDVA